MAPRFSSSSSMRRLLHAVAAFVALALSGTTAMCPSACSGHGVCTPANTCVCFDGYTGFDCFGRTCPTAPPWTDVATGPDAMRSAPRECANRGVCRRDSGRCDCDVGFAGAACEQLVAPCNGRCSGHGRCLSLRAVGPMRDDATLVSTAVYETPWDADRVFGCVCDAGYTGPGCTKRVCPFGDDPISTGQVDEIQALSCACNSCGGAFTLAFRGETTRALDPAVETDVTLRQALEALGTIRAVSVAVNGGPAGTKVCSTAGATTRITFTHEHGDVPALVVDTARITGGTSAITVQSDGPGTTQAGTKEWAPCSARGRCDSYNGICSCDSGFTSSDARGGSGDIADCGYRFGGAMTSCPVNYGYACSGHGTCSGTPLFQCACDDGYTGHDCSRRQCARGRAWWEEPLAANVAHMNLVECSNAGECDEVGMCRCFPGFEGVACDRLACPTSDNGVCSGRGQCKTARELAALTPTADFGVADFVYGVDPNAVATWDANMVQGCYCDKVHWKRGQSVRYTGHDCSKVPCPRGDDPWTSEQVDDMQGIECKATDGSFKLTFRGETTAPIASSASVAAVKAALESLRTISSVSVAFSAGTTTACTPSGNVISVTFYSPSGDLPVLAIDAAALTGAVTATSSKLQQGTKEDIVCNNRGRCDEDSGMCICALHHASSNARAGYGTLHDCGVVDKFMTHGEL